MMEDTIKLSTNDPTLHVNEEIRNDFSDVFNGFTFMFLFMFVVFFGMVIIKFLAS
ncbi:YqzM family protein [Paenibacillus guangzhouensis]|uniref:YqzM family protein n=1 Tax=Paenibacillus guangzhouensis TaxID=1473112 RepID=UPI0012674BE2|nr:YqzM family protein [Paenibacillus guangzhouensis]